MFPYGVIFRISCMNYHLHGYTYKLNEVDYSKCSLTFQPWQRQGRKLPNNDANVGLPRWLGCTTGSGDDVAVWGWTLGLPTEAWPCPRQLLCVSQNSVDKNMQDKDERSFYKQDLGLYIPCLAIYVSTLSHTFSNYFSEWNHQIRFKVVF